MASTPDQLQTGRPDKYPQPALVLQGVEGSPEQRDLHRLLLHPLHLPRHLPHDGATTTYCLPRRCNAWDIHHVIQVLSSIHFSDQSNLLLLV